MPERQTGQKEQINDDEHALKIHGNFSWGFKDRNGASSDDKLTLASMMDLKNINLDIKKGQFICVIGDVGSGKSNLLNAINGELLHCPNELMEGKENQEFDQKFFNEF